MSVQNSATTKMIQNIIDGTTPPSVANKVSHALTIIVDGVQTVFDGSVARTITIGSSDGNTTKEMTGKSSIQQITGIASNYTGSIIITNYQDISYSGNEFVLSVNPDGTEFQVMTMYSDGKTTMVLQINNGVVEIATMSGPSIYEEVVDIAYNYGNPTISQTFIFSSYSDDGAYKITYTLGSL